MGTQEDTPVAKGKEAIPDPSALQKLVQRLEAAAKASILNLEKAEFYKLWFGRMMYALLGSILLNFALGAAFIFTTTAPVKRDYFAYDPKTLSLISLIPTSEPMITDGAVLTWLGECVTQTNSYDFVNYRADLQRSSECFTDSGWNEFAELMNKSGNLERVKAQRLVASSYGTGQAVVTKKGYLADGSFGWEVEMPITTTYQGGQDGRTRLSQPLLLKLTVKRVDTRIRAKGIGIEHWVSEDR